jgi:hypothetical protein
MASLEGTVACGIGGMVGMAGALGYGFKRLVDVLADELKYNRKDIAGKLDQHIVDCRECRSRGGRKDVDG